MLSGIVAALLLVVFIAGWAWAWSPSRRDAFDAAARLPFEDEPAAGARQEKAP